MVLGNALFQKLDVFFGSRRQVVVAVDDIADLDVFIIGQGTGDDRANVRRERGEEADRLKTGAALPGNKA